MLHKGYIKPFSFPGQIKLSSFTQERYQNCRINHIDKPDKLHLAATVNRLLGHEALISLAVASLASSGYRQIARARVLPG